MSETKPKESGRRRFIEKLAAIGLLSPLATAPFKSLARQQMERSKPEPLELAFATAPYLQSPLPDSITVRFLTNLPAFSWVLYGTAENNLPHQKIATVDGLVNAHNRVNEIVLTGLQPDREYYYKVVSKEIKDFQPYKVTYGNTVESKTFRFRTMPANADRVSWLVLNDIHDRPYSFGELLPLNKDHYDFVFLNGDMFDYQTGEQQLIDHLIKPCTDAFASEKPFIFIRGNHEVRGKFAREIKPYFSNYGNGQYFTLDLGPVFMIALDTGEDKEDAHPVYAGLVDFDNYRKEQAEWMAQQMQSKAYRKAAFRMVMMHIPMFDSGDAHGPLHCREMFNGLCNKYKVDIVISGHTHRYGVHPPVNGQHNYPIIIGGGPITGTRTLIKVNASRKELNLQMLDDQGVEAGKYQLRK